jgi:ABC-type Fe3+-siderophore transport system permease subunit
MEHQNPNPLSDPTFYKITASSTALGLGLMAAFLFSLKDIGHDTSLEFSWVTIAAFVIGAALGWGFWAFVRRRTSTAVE